VNIEKSIFIVLDAKREFTHSYYFQSWYSPIFLKARNELDANNSTCITFEVRQDKDKHHYIVLKDILPPSLLDSHEVVTHLKNMNSDFTNHALRAMPSLYTQKCVIIPANDTVNNIFSISLQKDNIPIRRLYIEDNGIDVEGLIHQAVKIVRNKGFFLLPSLKLSNVLRTIDKDFLNMISTYPDSESYSLCYAWAQGLVYASKYLHTFEEDKKTVKKSTAVNHGYGVEID
jgi:hypothetical protein